MAIRPSDVEKSPRAVASPGFVGRDREVATLAAALAGPPAVVLVEGEAGVGKSRLVHESLRSPGALVAACPPLREPLTLGPIVDAVRAARDSVEGLELTPLAGALRPLFPEWSDGLPPALDALDDGKAARHRLFRALAELVRALGVRVLVIEDVHWADDVTLEFVLFLASRPQADRPHVVLTYRPEEVDDDSLLLRLSSGLPAGTNRLRVVVEPLNRDDTASLVSSMLDGEPMSAEFAAFLHDRTDGLPLAVEESVRLLHERGDLILRAGQWVRLSLAELQVPPTVRDATRERVSRLPADAQRVLRAAAILADPSAEPVLVATSGLTLDEARAGLDAAAAAGLLDADDRGRWRFRHVLVASAVYDAIGLTDRRDLHERAGRALEELAPPPVAQLARHFREAGDTTRWVRYAELTAERAIASADHGTAVAVLLDLLSAVELPPADRARIARMAGLAGLGRREPVDALHHRLVATLRAMLEKPDLTDRQDAEVRNALGRLLINAGEAEAALAELERSVTHLDHEPVEAARAMTFLGWAYAGPWPASTHLRWLRRAAELGPRISSPSDRLSLAGNRAAALLMLGEDAAWTEVAALPTDGASAAERLDVARIHANIGTGALLWGRYADAERHLAIALGHAEAEGSSRLSLNVALEKANLDWFTGRWDGLVQRAQELGEADRDRPGTYLASLRLIARLSAAAGRPSAAAEGFQQVLDESVRVGAVDDAVGAAAALGRMALVVGDPRAALQVTDEPAQMIEAKGVWVWATELAPVRVEALLAVGDAAAAAALTDRLADGLIGRNAPGPHAALALCRALLTSGASDFGRAAEAWDALPRPYDAWLARERKAAALLDDGQADAGRTLLSEVYEGLLRLGARGDAERVAVALRRHGVDVPRPWRGGRRGYGDGLSPRELDVVRLVVAGHTNREIARILSKSPATVDQQLRSAMRKLKVSSRTALAVAAVEAGVLAEESSSRVDA